MARRHRRNRRARPHRLRRILLVLGALLAEVSGTWRRGYRLTSNVVVRCQRGHLFTTIWIPGASAKSLRFGWWRFQYCPVGKHWSVVTPVRTAGLTDDEKVSAAEHRDIRIP